MAFKSYHTMNGQIIGDSDADYILDGLGSVIGTWRTTGTIQNQYRYSGYGQQVHKSGTGADPYFLWVGGWGYRTRGMVYVRRRTFYEKAAVWTSVDPLWPDESAYGYGGPNAISVEEAYSATDSRYPLELLRQAPKLDRKPGHLLVGTPEVPSMGNCYDGAPPGFTDCNILKGGVWMRVCASPCTFDCTRKHEEVHVKQLSECCRRAGLCYNKKYADKQRCRSRFTNWRDGNRDAFECEAYTVSCKCFENQAFSLGCCIELPVNTAYDCLQRDLHCKGKPKVTRCPFDALGNPIP